MLKKILPFLVLLVMAALAWTISRNPPEVQRAEKKDVPALVVDVQTVQPEDYRIRLKRYGRVIADKQTLIRSEASGRILRLSKQLQAGQRVSKGDLLLQLDDTDARAELAIARSGLAESEQNLARQQAQTDQAREAWQLSGRSGEPGPRVLQLPQLLAAEAQVASARSSVKLAELALSKRRILAPFEGTVASVSVEQGEAISAGSEIAQLISDQPPQIEISLQPRDLSVLDLSGQGRVTIRSAAGEFTGQLMQVYPTLDPTSQQLQARVLLTGTDTGKGPLVGELIEAELEGRLQPQVIRVANEVLYQNRYLYLVKDKRLQRREVVTGWQDGRYTLIEQGLEPGDQLVTTALGQVASGTQVQVAAADGETP